MTTGHGLGDPSTQSYPAQLMALINNRFCRSNNQGVNSQTVEQMIADAAATIDVLYDKYDSKRFVLALAGTNDLYFGATPATTYSRISTYHSGRRTAGFKTVAFTILPRSEPGTPPTFEADRQTVNTNIRANWRTFADGLADVAADGRIGDAGDELDLTYYQADRVHMNATGYGIVAAIAKAVVDGL